jgi:hypothetical protein
MKLSEIEVGHLAMSDTGNICFVCRDNKIVWINKYVGNIDRVGDCIQDYQDLGPLSVEVITNMYYNVKLSVG